MKIPYALTAAVALHERYAHMDSALARGLPRLQSVPIDDTRTLHVACYGPSLRETWRALGRPLLSMSGATQWLAARGMVPDYHIDMDPRQNKALDVTPPVPGVRYLLASVCPPAMFDALAGQDVTLWHTVSSNEEDDLRWVAAHDPGELLVSTGSTIGLGALQIGGLLGYRHFEVHGMDGSFAGPDRHAGPHTDPRRQADDVTWAAGGVTYRTSAIMANGVAETINALTLYPIFVVLHGQGLTQALVREAALPNVCTVDEPDQAARIRVARAQFVAHPPVDRAQMASWSTWEAICFANPDPHWVGELQTLYAIAEGRRPLARFQTGSISLETGLLLRALCQWRKPRVIVEVGTFIGKSTVALQASDRIYTCDKDHDCLPATRQIVPYPYTTSTTMLHDLVARGVRADLCFLDGRLRAADLPLLLQVSTPETIYAFDDFVPHGKGLANIEALVPHLRSHGLVEPYRVFGDRTSLALLVPMQAQAVAA